jgi:muramidase (phage lysozyme)
MQGYVDAARMFQQESGTAPAVNLEQITDRMQIRQAVQAGRVEEAIDKVNDLNPEVRQQQWVTLYASRLPQQQQVVAYGCGCMTTALQRFFL